MFSSGMESLAMSLGLSTAVIRFLLCFLASLPISYCHRLVHGTQYRHMYSFVSGGLLCWIAYGGFESNRQLYIPIVLAYVAMQLTREFCGYITFGASFAFLVFCHVSNLSGDKWRGGGMDYTGTLMIITLKVISVAMDYQDGLLPPQQAAKKTLESRVEKCPSLLEFLGYLFCCGSILVGPIFDFKTYKSFSEKEGVWEEKSSRPLPNPVTPAVRSLLAAAGCAVVYQTLNAHFPGTFLTTPPFFHLPLWRRWGYIVLASFSYRWLYYFIWKVAETAMVLSGLGFSGWEGEKPQWDRAVNVTITGVELGESAAQLPASWNMSVGHWLRTYVYERVSPYSGKPGLRTLIITQGVSALWHGLHPGYFLFFVNCALAQHASKALYKRHLSISPKDRFWWSLSWMAQFLYAHTMLDYSELGFILLGGGNTLRVWASVYFIGTIPSILIPFILSALPRTSKDKQQRANTKKDL